MKRPDFAALGTSGFVRNENDHYVTPARTVNSLLSVIELDLPGYPVWEPFCGNGAFTKALEPTALNIVSTDIKAYDGFTPDALLDFFKVLPTAGYEAMKASVEPDVLAQYKTLADIEAIKGFMPDVIISNPPYDEAEACVRHSIALMEEVKGMVIFLLRHEYDCAKSRRDLFEKHPFSQKITLLHRPRWIEGSTGAPRHNYAYYVWDWTRPAAVKPELIYAT